MKLSELKTIIRDCIEELNEGQARIHRHKYGKSQDIGYLDAPEYIETKYTPVNPKKFKSVPFGNPNNDTNPRLSIYHPIPQRIGTRPKRGDFKRIGKMGDKKQ